MTKIVAGPMESEPSLIGARKDHRPGSDVRDTLRKPRTAAEDAPGSSSTRRYTGPERRKRSMAFSGPDRRAGPS